MNVFVITACYKFKGKLEKYVESFMASYEKYKSRAPKFNFLFINDDPDPYSLKDLMDTISPLRREHSVFVLNNMDNLGVTRSRNKAVIRLYEDKFYKNKTWVDLNPYTDYLMYFDCDDIWDIDSVNTLSNIPKYDLVFYPCEIEEFEQDKSIKGLMTLGKFCTFIPHLECTYLWRLHLVFDYILEHGNFWYESEDNCKLFTEDMIFLTIPDISCLVMSDSICHCSRNTGSYCNDWRSTIHKNILSFRRMAELHRKNMRYYEYPEELIKYVEYLESYQIL